MQNLFGSHDFNRLSSHIVNGGIGVLEDVVKYGDLSSGRNENYIKTKPKKIHYQIQKLFAIFQFTYIGKRKKMFLFDHFNRISNDLLWR